MFPSDSRTPRMRIFTTSESSTRTISRSSLTPWNAWVLSYTISIRFPKMLNISFSILLSIFYCNFQLTIKTYRKIVGYRHFWRVSFPDLSFRRQHSLSCIFNSSAFKVRYFVRLNIRHTQLLCISNLRIGLPIRSLLTALIHIASPSIWVRSAYELS